MKKTVQNINQIIFTVAAAVVAFLIVGCVQKFVDIELGSTAFRIAFTGIISVQMFIFIKFLFRLIDLIESKYKYGKYIIAVVLFLIMIAIMTILLFVIRSTPEKDSFDDLDAAWYIYKYGAVDAGNIHVSPLGKKANNHFIILLFAALYKFFEMLGISNVLMAMFVVNAFTIVAGAFFMWLFVKDEYDLNRANKCLLFIVLNPLIYWLMFWIYSLSYSLPLTTILLWAICRIKNSKNTGAIVVYSIILAIDLVLGYLVRPTAVFPFIAFCIVGLLYMIKEQQIKKFLLMIIVVVLCALPLMKVYNHVNDYYFGNVSESEYPLWYYFSMGSHGNGDLSTKKEDQKVADEVEDYRERSEALKKMTLDNYRSNGIVGTAKLWAKKTCNTWSAGYGEIYERIWNGERENIVAEYMYGTHKFIPAIFAQAFRVISLVSILAFCCIGIRNKSFKMTESVILLAMLGGIVFFFLWEAKYIYSFPFYFILSIISVLGFDNISLKTESQTRTKTAAVIVCGVIAVALLTDFYFIVKKDIDVEHVRIKDLGFSTKTIDITEPSFKQEFCSSKPFNRLWFYIRSSNKPDLDEYVNTSDYELKLMNGDETVFETECGMEDVSNRLLIWNLPESVGGGNYTVLVNKKNEDMDSMFFTARNSYKMDYYRGNLVIGENDIRPYDLKMNVSFDTHEQFMGLKERFIFIIVCLGIALCDLAYMMGYADKKYKS